MAMQNMCKHATYYTDKISSSYLFVFCVRLKTFQPPLVCCISLQLGYVAYHLIRQDKGNIIKPTPGLYLISIKSYQQKRTLTSWRHYLTSTDLSGGHICKVAQRSHTVALLSNEHGSERFEQIW